MVGHDLITTDGTTLLGADDKAGVAIIMDLANYLYEHPEVKHNDIKIAFTPDEEVGRGADNFDVNKFGAKYAYTWDGGDIEEYNYENFNAYSAQVVRDCLDIEDNNEKLFKGSLFNKEIGLVYDNCFNLLKKLEHRFDIKFNYMDISKYDLVSIYTLTELVERYKNL